MNGVHCVFNLRSIPNEPQLYCESTYMTLRLDRSILEIGDDPHNVHFEDESCVGIFHDSKHIEITTSYDRCDTQQEENEDYIEFSNLVTYSPSRPFNGSNQGITRHYGLQFPVTCHLQRKHVLGDSFVPHTGLELIEEDGYGEFSLTLYRYTSPGFSQLANDSGSVEVGTRLYFGVHLNSVTNLTLLIESCWATGSPYPWDDHRYDIIDNGCAVDITTNFENNFEANFKGFSVEAFTLIGEYERVYVHCSILVCDNSDSSSRCAQGCLTRSRRSLEPMGSRSKPHTITNGPLSDDSHRVEDESPEWK